NTSVGIRDVLAVLGIEAEFQGSAWVVKGLSAQSAAQRSGVKAGDIIQSVDGRRLKEDTKFSGSFSGRTLRIVREGKSMDLDLKDQKNP
ncbi:MAG: PDZ domain-containing protein, partial [Acidobacteriota bacterium]